MSQIQPVLDDLGIETISIYSMLSTSATIDGLIESAAERADLVVGVVSRDKSTANVFYELGYAAALRKRILVLVPDGQPLPMDVARFSTEFIDLNDRTAIRFAVERALSSPRPRKQGKIDLRARDRESGQTADLWLTRLGEVGDDPVAFERLISDALSAGEGHRIADTPGSRDVGYDFLLWSEAIQPYLGNPLPVEVKLRIRSTSDLDRVVSKLLSVGSRYQASWRLLVVKDFQPKAKLQTHRYPHVLVFQADDLLKRMREKPLSTVLVDERNAIFHGGR